MSTKEGAVFDRSTIKKDLRSIYSMGYFTDKIKAVPVASQTGVTLKVRVEENVPVIGFNITGNEVVSTDEISSIVTAQAGLPQNIVELNKAVKDIEDLYAKKGYILGRVTKIQDDPDGLINIDINEGIIDEIKITGNTCTKEFVIKRNIVTEPNKIYNEKLLREDLTRIYGTRAFSDVRRVLSPSTNDPDKYLLTIEVDEKRTGSVSLGGGLDTGTGLFGSLGYGDTNFRGLGQELSFSFMTGSGLAFGDDDTIKRANIQFEAKFVEPRFKQTLNSLEVKAFGREFASYQVPLSIERRVGGEVQIARPFKTLPSLAGAISIGVEGIDLKEGDEDKINALFKERSYDISQRAEQLKAGTFLTLGPSLVYDTRNNIINTRDGAYARIKLNESIKLSGDVSSFGTVSGTLRKYFPLGEKSTFTVAGKMGAKASSKLPEFAAFRLGGPRSIRGFKEGDAGNGEGFMMASAELRTPIPFMDKITKIRFFNNMRTAFFLDAGTLFRETLTTELYQRPGYGIACGGGLRIMIPGLGPINLDYGIPLTNVGPKGKKNGRFTYGFGDIY